jgi:hypothetical protein
MRTRIAGGCEDGKTCPTIFAEGDGSFAIQGYIILAPEGVPEGEALVRIPRELLLEAAQKLER